MAFPNSFTEITPFETQILDTHIQNIETKVGLDNSVDPDSLDYKLCSITSTDPGHKHNLADGAVDLSAM